jgi:FKBP-type peptidyl-prolyl cis-trans isomerase
MSWSIELEPKKLYSHTPEATVIITNIALVNPTNAQRHIVKIVVDGQSFNVCILNEKTPSMSVKLLLEADKEFTFFHEGTGKVHIIGMKQRYLCFAGSDSELESFDLDSDIEALDQDAYYLGSGSDDEEDSEESGLNDDEINAIIKGELKKRKRVMEKTKVVPEQQEADSDSDSEPPAKKPKTNNTNGNNTPKKAVLPSPQTPSNKNNDKKASQPNTPKTAKNIAENKSNTNTPKAANEKKPATPQQNQKNVTANNTPKTNEKKKNPEQSPAAKNSTADNKTPSKPVVSESPKVVVKPSEIIPELAKISRPVISKKRKNDFLIDELKVGDGKTPKLGQTVKLDYVVSMPNGEVVLGKQNEEVRLGFMSTFKALEQGAEGMFDGGIRRIYVPKREGEDIRAKCSGKSVEETLKGLIDDQVAFIIDVKLQK